MASTCDGCSLQLLQLVPISKSRETVIKFLANHNLIKLTCVCSSCGSILTAGNDYKFFSCNKVKVIRRNKTVKRRRCNFKKSVFAGTFFDHSHLPVETVLHLMYWFVFVRASYEEIQEQVNVSPKTLIERFSYAREVVIYYCEKNSEKLGGPGKTVEIYEAKLGKRKYDKICAVETFEDAWVLGGFERESRKAFLIPVLDRNQETFIEKFKQWILPKTNIIFDCCPSYSSLLLEGYGNDESYETVDHRQNFVDPETGATASMHNIEDCWWDDSNGNVRKKRSKTGQKKLYIDGYLAMDFFVRKFPQVPERFHEFLLAAAEL